jgi:hypothetical protein
VTAAYFCDSGVFLLQLRIFGTAAYLQRSTHLLDILIKTFFGRVLDKLLNLTYLFTTQANFSFLVTV